MAGAILSLILFAGCSFGQWYEPSLQYLRGEGYYSRNITRGQLQEAAAKGKVQERGRFAERSSGCFDYTEASIDRNIVIPTVRKKMIELEADAAEQIMALSALELNPLVYWAVGIFGCSFWTIAGNAVHVETP
ncbi:MAG TPA: hypothetical protein VJ692_03275 [Nitrospiraceae bacterium]|nr:hypothetical protein [Nitrospiraceae bacterium]